MSIQFKCDDCGKPIAERIGGGSPAPVFCVAWGTRDTSNRYIPIAVYDLCEACYTNYAKAAFSFRDKFRLEVKLEPTEEEAKEFANAIKAGRGRDGLDAVARLFGTSRLEGETDIQLSRRIILCQKGL